MCRKCTCIIVSLVFLVVGSSAFAGAMDRQANWHNTSGCDPADGTLTNEYNAANNWGFQINDTNYPCGSVMDSSIWACIEAKPPDPCVSEDSYCSRLSIHPWSWNYAPDINFVVNAPGATFDCGVCVGLADNAPFNSDNWGQAILQVYAGDVVSAFEPNEPLGWIGLHVGGGNNGLGQCYGTVNLFGGSITVPNIHIFNGDVNLYGGYLYDTNGVADINGVEPDFNDEPGAYKGDFYISEDYDRNRINIEGGELRVEGDRAEELDYYIKKGLICACSMHGVLTVEMEGSYTKITGVCTLGQAWKPTPRDNQTRIALDNLNMSWSPGNYVAYGDPNGHYVYLGTDFDEVNDADTDTAGIFLGQQDANSLLVVGPLEGDSYYYWRIDEVNEANAANPLMWKGHIWQFRTQGGEAIDPSPAHKAVGIPVPLELTWMAGVWATTGHDVYFGTSEDDVADATTGAPLGVYQTRLAAGTTTFLLSDLAEDLARDTDYYWRIDEVGVKDTNAMIWPGEVWRFTNTNYFIIEDFESYDNTAQMEANWETGYEACPYKTANGTISLDKIGGKSMVLDYAVAVGAWGDFYFSEAKCTVGGKDWTGGGALPVGDPMAALVMTIIGDAFNGSDPTYNRMYVVIEDTDSDLGMVLHGDPQSQRDSIPHQWGVDLSDFDACDVDLDSVEAIYVGFGVRCLSNSEADDSPSDRGAVIEFDDIRLYQQYCNPEERPIADFSGDCVVGYEDVDLLVGDSVVGDWLASARIEATTPVTATPVLWYKMDQGANDEVVDEVSGHNGAIVNYVAPASSYWIATDGVDGNGCLQFLAEPNAYVEIAGEDADDALDFTRTATGVTFSVWIKADYYTPNQRWSRLISIWQDVNEFDANDNFDEVVEIECPTPRPPGWDWGPQARIRIGLVNAAYGPVDTNETGTVALPWSDFAGEWNHYAFVRDKTNKKLKIYCNGGIIADANTDLSTMFGITEANPFSAFRLASRDGYFENCWTGRIDDLRVYDYALSDAEIAWLGTTDHDGVIHLKSEGNLEDSGSEAEQTIDFGDLAVLGDEWGQELLWPQP